MTDEELKRLLEAQTERIEKRFDDVDKRFETIDQRFETMDKRFETVDKRLEAVDEKVDDTVAEIRRQFGAFLEHFDRKFDGLVAALALLDEKIDRKTAAIEQRMDLGFADTQAMIKFSHAELDRRVRYMEQTLQTLEDKFATLNTRVERLEETTRAEN
jgi:tetrahydromethanopterin S-methyltransferase subunit G